MPTTSNQKSENAASTVDKKAKRLDHPRHLAQDAQAPEKDLSDTRPRESGGQTGPDPTRYGDWEKKGRCTDF
ncbi:MAG: DUF1674 domain-containing protein [Granulosicoccus sp.]|nr:DUF1674 domain-containing protein [Granulosicoccus sp.]